MSSIIHTNLSHHTHENLFGLHEFNMVRPKRGTISNWDLETSKGNITPRASAGYFLWFYKPFTVIAQRAMIRISDLPFDLTYFQ